MLSPLVGSFEPSHNPMIPPMKLKKSPKGNWYNAASTTACANTVIDAGLAFRA